MDRPWFDQETDVLLIDEYIVEMDSYKRIVEEDEDNTRAPRADPKRWLRFLGS